MGEIEMYTQIPCDFCVHEDLKDFEEPCYGCSDFQYFQMKEEVEEETCGNCACNNTKIRGVCDDNKYYEPIPKTTI